MVAVARRSGDIGGGATGNARAARVRHRWFVTAAVEQGLSRASCARRADPRAPADRAPRAARLAWPLVGAPRPPAAGAGSGARVRRTRIDERGGTKKARRANADRGSERRKLQEQRFFAVVFARHRRSSGRFFAAVGGLCGGFPPGGEVTWEVTEISWLLHACGCERRAHCEFNRRP